MAEMSEKPNTPRLLSALERVVEDLADPYRWNWMQGCSHRDAADHALTLLAREGIIEKSEHPSGGLIWRVNGKLFGRTDGITHAKFDKRKRAFKE